MVKKETVLMIKTTAIAHALAGMNVPGSDRNSDKSSKTQDWQFQTADSLSTGWDWMSRRIW